MLYLQVFAHRTIQNNHQHKCLIEVVPFKLCFKPNRKIMLPGSLTLRILQRFPGKLTYCIAYGSGVKKQTGYDDKSQKDAMVDLMFSVDDPIQFHDENLKKNPHDYSFMRFLGPKLVGEFQDYASGVYCNTLIPIDEHTTIKYGVIRTSDLCDDLNHWTHIYVAGRLHKPVETLIEPTSQELKDGLIKNHENALRAALLMLPKEFTYFELFHEIANISYHMDFRMIFGEKKDKVKNIVEPQQNMFLKLYAPYLKKLSASVELPEFSVNSDKRIQQDKSPTAILEHLKAMPERIQVAFKGMEEPIEGIAVKPHHQAIVRSAIGGIIWESSIAQTLKNIPTAGLLKSIRYGARKALKTFKK